MRVITGIARGRKLKVLEGDSVRPTTDKVKESVFSAIQFDIEGRRVLDLFAGSGQLGIEAISRGAEKVTFIDNFDDSLNVVRENIANLDFSEFVNIMKSDYASYLLMTPDRFDIAFLDPPYNKGILQNALEIIPRVMNEYGIVVCEHPVKEVLPEQVDRFKIHKTYKYGKIAVTIYRNEVI